MFRKMVAVGIATAAALVILSAALSKGAGPRAETEGAEFDGKIVCVTPAREGVKVVEKATIKRLAGRAFIVGTAVNTIYGDYPPMTYWLPIDDAQALVVFNTVEDAKKALEIAAKEDAQKGDK